VASPLSMRPFMAFASCDKTLSFINRFRPALVAHGMSRSAARCPMCGDLQIVLGLAPRGQPSIQSIRLLQAQRHCGDLASRNRNNRFAMMPSASFKNRSSARRFADKGSAGTLLGSGNRCGQKEITSAKVQKHDIMRRAVFVERCGHLIYTLF